MRRLRICSHVYQFLGLVLGIHGESKPGRERKAEDRVSGSNCLIIDQEEQAEDVWCDYLS